MEPLNAIMVFVRIVETNSFTAAAARLGISPSGVSRSLTRLEERLGVRLLNRSTRSLSLTDDGRSFFQSCQAIIRNLEEAENAIVRRSACLSGRIRMIVPDGFGRFVALPHILDFADLYPDVTLDVEFSDRKTDFAADGIDIVIFGGKPPEYALVIRKLCDLRIVVVASPQYLENRGTPSTVEDLALHRCLGHLIPHTNRYRGWPFANTDTDPPTISGGLNFDNGDALARAALRHAGIISVPSYLVSDAVADGTLKVVLPHLAMEGPPMYIGYLQKKEMAPRIRALIDHIVKRLSSY